MANVYGKFIPPGQGGGKFFKLADGEKAVIRLISDEPLLRNSSYQGGPPSTRYSWVVYNHDAEQAQIMDQSVMVYKSIENMAVSRWGDPTTYDVEIKRTGTGTETRYWLTPLPNSQDLTREQKTEAAAIDLKEQFPNGVYASEVYDGKEIPAEGGDDQRAVDPNDFPTDPQGMGGTELSADEIDVNDIPF